MIDVGRSDGCSAYLIQHIVHYVIRMYFETPVSSGSVYGVELCLPPNIDGRLYAALVAHCHICIDVEVFPIRLIWLNGKEILHAFTHVLKEVPLGNVFGIIAVA